MNTAEVVFEDADGKVKTLTIEGDESQPHLEDHVRTLVPDTAREVKHLYSWKGDKDDRPIEP